MKKIFFGLLFVIVTNFSYSQKSAARFLYWPPSAESTSLGGAGVSIIDNSFSAYYNPSSFAFSKKLNIAGSFMQPFSSFQNTAQFMLSLACPIEEFGTLALSLNSFWSDNQIRTSENDPSALGGAADNPKLFDPTNYQIKLSYANRIMDNLSVGLSLSFLRIGLTPLAAGQEQGDGNVSTVLFDLGFLVKDLFNDITYSKLSSNNQSLSDRKIQKGITIGLSVLNLGPEIFFINKAQSDPPPSFAILGFSYTPVITDIISSKILVDFEKRIYDSNKLDYIHTGGEIQFWDLVSLRVGYSFNNINADQSFPTYGIGINYKSISANLSRYKKYFLSTWQFDTRISLEI